MKCGDKKRVRTFGWGLAGVFALFGTLKFILGKSEGVPWQYYAAAAAALINTVVPAALTPVYKAAIFIARRLGWFNTRLLLGLIYFLMFTPLALLFRIIGRDALDRKIDRKADSYWQRRECKKFDPRSVENQY